MGKHFSIELEGEKELMDFFGDLPQSFTNQVLGDIAQKGASVIRSEARRMMPIDGELGQIGKKAVIIAKDKQNKTQRDVTIGSQYITYKGKETSLGKIIRHLTAGHQNVRKTANGANRGKAEIRLGDFIQRAFERKKDKALAAMKEITQKVIEKRARRVKGITYGR